MTRITEKKNKKRAQEVVAGVAAFGERMEMGE
jgi:hypothetical protein